MSYNQSFKNITIENINKISSDPNIEKVVDLMIEAFKNKKKIYTFGTGHSHMLGEELYVRAGGWNYIIPMLVDEITLSSHPWKSTWIEREPGYANVLLSMFPLHKDDVIIITSNSGRNGLIVEMALRAKKKGAHVIAVTSVEHASSVASRHNSKKLLKDIGEIIIDNLSPIGDTNFTISNESCGSTSTIINCYIAQLLTLLVFEKLNKLKIPFQTFKSSNLDNEDDRNESIL